ncbi:SRPBCC domain-containing protein [Sinorhizobium medicae]|uniref:SRPBCC domain-containing protein n=1 Tax=Sinorhizobium medicae TaxID=110321 RepID=UPI00299ED0EC
MTEAQLFHGTFTLKRIWAAPPHRVFDAWSDPQLKAQWFTGPPERCIARRSG